MQSKTIGRNLEAKVGEPLHLFSRSNNITFANSPCSRLYKVYLSEMQYLREIEALRFLPKLNKNIVFPKIWRTGYLPESSSYFSQFSFIEGRRFDTKWLDNYDLVSKLFIDLGKTASEIHKNYDPLIFDELSSNKVVKTKMEFDTYLTSKIIEWFKALPEHYKPLDKKEWNGILEDLTNAKWQAPRICHGDLKLKNILCKETDYSFQALVDFEHCGIFPPFFEMRTLYSDCFILHPELERKFYKGYKKNVVNSRNVARALALFDCLGNLQWSLKRKFSDSVMFWITRLNDIYAA